MQQGYINWNANSVAIRVFYFWVNIFYEHQTISPLARILTWNSFFPIQ